MRATAVLDMAAPPQQRPHKTATKETENGKGGFRHASRAVGVWGRLDFTAPLFSYRQLETNWVGVSESKNTRKPQHHAAPVRQPGARAWPSPVATVGASVLVGVRRLVTGSGRQRRRQQATATPSWMATGAAACVR